VKILIADDHAIVRKGLHMILANAYSDVLIEEVVNGAELLLRSGENNWDIIISDISMPGISGAVIVKKIKKRFPKIPVLILSTHPAEHYAFHIFKAGASGYLTKECAPEDLVKAVDHILSGKKYISPEIAEMMADLLQNDFVIAVHQHLSDLEIEIFKLISEGKTGPEIALILSLSSAKINTSRTRILLKMHMHNTADLIRYAQENQLF